MSEVGVGVVDATAVSLSRRARVLIAVGIVVAVLVIATGSIVSLSRHHPARPIVTSVAVPAGVQPAAFGKADLGVQLQLPSTYQTAPPIGRTEYNLRDPASGGFFLAGSYQMPGGRHVAAGQFGYYRGQSLHKFGATKMTRSVVLVDGHKAAEFRYHLDRDGLSVDDLEYDIDLGHSAYAILIIGQSSHHPIPDTMRWIASTIRVG